MPGLNGRRVAVIAGVRTPFTKAGTSLKDVRAVDLARYAARELLERTNLDGTEVDEVIFGQVVPSPLVPKAKSCCSTKPTFSPRIAASRAIPAPVMPPPIMSTSTGVSAMDAQAAARVCSNSPPLSRDGRFRLPGRERI